MLIEFDCIGSWSLKVTQQKDLKIIYTEVCYFLIVDSYMYVLKSSQAWYRPFFYLTGRVANLVIILTDHNSL